MALGLWEASGMLPDLQNAICAIIIIIIIILIIIIVIIINLGFWGLVCACVHTHTSSQ